MVLKPLEQCVHVGRDDWKSASGLLALHISKVAFPIQVASDERPPVFKRPRQFSTKLSQKVSHGLNEETKPGE